MQKKRTKTYTFYMRLCMTCAISIYLISLIDFERIKSVLLMLKIKYAWQAFVLVLLTNLAVSMRWSILLFHFKIKQRIIESWRYYMVGGFYSLVLPGIIGEDVVRLGLSLRAQQGKNKALLTTSILFERACGTLIILVMASVGAFLVPRLLEGEKTLINLILMITSGAFLLSSIFLLIVKISPKFWLKKTKTFKTWKKHATTLIEYYGSLPIKTLFFFLLLSMLAQFLDIVGSYFLSRAVNIEQPFAIFLLIMPLAYVMTILPISIGGIGVREGVLAYFLVKVGVMASDAVLLALIIYFNRVLVGLIGGILQFTKKRNLAW